MKQFILYDGRAKTGDTDVAQILDTAETEIEAREEGASRRGEDGIWYEYDVQAPKDPSGTPILVNGKARWDLPPAKDSI